MDEEGEGPEEVGVAHINEHGKDHFGGVLACSWTEAKGRILRATRSYAPGEVILVESPLHIVQEDGKSAAFKRLQQLCSDFGEDFDYEPLWYWCAVQSLTEKQLQGAKASGCTGTTPQTQHNLLLLHHEGVKEPSRAARILARDLAPGADATLLERLIQIWVLNCFEYSDAPQGYSTYFFSSFMSHSCFPNAVWHYTGAEHVLRSRREIKVGDEVCISYLPESGLLQSAPARRKELHETKQFWCDCERCAPGVEDLSRGLRCPRCREGCIFARTPEDGPARDGAVLLASQLAGAACSREECGHVVSKADAGKLAGYEKKMQEMVDKYSKSEAQSVKQLQADEAFIDEHFRQHVLADLVWEQFGSHYAAKRRLPDQRRLLERRVEFHRGAYPGLSGAHAWALEALGDCLKSSTPKPLSNDRDAIRSCYNEALETLRLMFGDEHEYVSDVVAKLADLR